MADKYVIEVVGAHRVERALLNDERRLAEELREATRKAEELLMREAKAAAPHPRKGLDEEQGEGIESSLNFPQARGGLRRLAGRAPGGATLVSLTYEVSLFIREPASTVAAYFEQGTGKYGPLGAPYNIPNFGGGPLLLTGGAGGNPSGHWLGNLNTSFRGGQGEKLPIFDHVTHPGIRPRPFLEDTVRDNAPEVDKIYDHAVASAIKGF